MTKESGVLTQPWAVLPQPESLESAARVAFAEHVRLYDEEDEIVVQKEPNQLRLVYLSIRASRHANWRTFIHCRVDHECQQMWINSLQVTGALRGQGLGRELVTAAEATARAIELDLIRVYPLTNAVGFWESLGYMPDERMSRVLQKDLR